jgi:hypothetical protein
MLKRAPFGIAAVLGLALSAPLAAAPLLLDDFSDPSPAVMTTITGTSSVTFVDFGSMLGGVRETNYNLYSNPSLSSVVLTRGAGSVGINAGPDALGELLLSYGAFTRPTGDPSVPGPFLGQNLTPYDALELDFTSVDQPLNINVVYYTSAPLASSCPPCLYYSQSGVNIGPDAPGDPLTVLLSFNPDPAFNFGQVDGVVVLIDRSGDSRGNAYSLDSMEFVNVPVPEPGTGQLLQVGLSLLPFLPRLRRFARPRR